MKIGSHPKRRTKKKQKPRKPARRNGPIYQQYAEDVVSGRILACKALRQACERHIRDYGESLTKKNRGIWFDFEEANFQISLIELFPQSKGEWGGQPLKLEPWEQFIVANLFGWKRADGTRRYRTAYIEVPRKNGKSTLMAAIGIILLVADDEPGAEVYSAATKKDQARIVWSEAERMVKSSPSLKKIVTCFRDNLHIAGTASKFEPLATDEDSLDGLNIHGALVDELHAHKTRKVWDVIETATGARRQPLKIAITTAGDNQDGICYELRSYGIKLLEKALDDDSFFIFVATVDPEDLEHWDQEHVWRKANPNFGVSVKPDDMRELAKKARETPTAKNAFLRLRLNVWVNSSTPWMPMESWNACGQLDYWEMAEQLKGRRCFGGLDLASTQDLAAFAALFPPLNDTEPWKALFKFWLPDNALLERATRDGVPYHVWKDQRYLTTTPGEIIDYRQIRRDIVKFGDDYVLGEIGFDPYNATELATELTEEDGFVMVQMKQTYQFMSEPMKKLMSLVVAGQFEHGGNPIAKWNASNTVAKSDHMENVRPIKQDRKKRIDGTVALIMANARAVAGTTPYTVPRVWTV